MQRLRLYDIRLSRIPSLIGVCQSNTRAIADAVNAAQRRLIFAKEAGDEGWYGTWAEVLFYVSRSQPYITLPREIARIQSLNICDEPVTANNQFYEYLQFGNGRLPKRNKLCGSRGLREAVSRNNSPLWRDLSGKNRTIRVYMTDDQDVNKRVIVSGTDDTDAVIYTQDVYIRIQGLPIVLANPFTDSSRSFNTITGIQKDVTAGDVHIFEVDPDIGEETLLLTMRASETTGWYRRYYFDNLPNACCEVPGGGERSVAVTAICKLDPIPVMVDTDYLLLQNLEALTEEVQSLRYSEIDKTDSKEMAEERHTQAIRLLMGELTHYLGKDALPINFAPFGSARLERRKVGMII